MRMVEKQIMLQMCWISAGSEHLAAMDYLRQGIGLRAYAQKAAQAGIQA
jgi:preprotein translocase subunit SecA